MSMNQIVKRAWFTEEQIHEADVEASKLIETSSANEGKAVYRDWIAVNGYEGLYEVVVEFSIKDIDAPIEISTPYEVSPEGVKLYRCYRVDDE